MNKIAPISPAPPEHTGERISIDISPSDTLQQHAARYVFASQYCRGADVLDVASGLGYGTDYLRSKGAHISGLELDEQAVSYSRTLYPLSNFVNGSAEEMPANWNESFDVVVSFETIEHLKNPDIFLSEVFRCLRSGGLFVCSTPNKSLSLFQGQNQFHVKEFYYKEFLGFIETRFLVSEVFGQCFHPRWSVVYNAFHILMRKVLNVFRVPPLGISSLFTGAERSSPFEGRSIAENKVLSEFKPTIIPPNKIPSFVIVVAQKKKETK